jgi:signal transduction histidine kinase/ActR/RegA family two-component response regulator
MAGEPLLDMDTVVEALEALGDGIAIYNQNDVPIFTNAVTRRRFASIYADTAKGMSYRQSTEAAVRRGIPPGVPESEVQKLTDHFVNAYHKGESYVVQSDDQRWVQVTFRNMSRGLKAAISVDITDLRKRERELDKARKMAEAASHSKSAFLANMSHEIRTPLNGVLGMAQVMEGTDLSQQQKEFVSTIIESGKTLMALLNDVLDLSKIEAGKFDVVPVDTDLAHMLRRSYRLWKPRAEEKGLEFSLTLDAELPDHLSFDAVRVQQCVSNLVSNAIKFTREGRVEISARAKPLAEGHHMVEIRVTDTGPGMDEETQARLFQAFAQADETISRKHGGTGLGLSITRRLSEMMGGQASVTSEPGKGSTFRISFRAAPPKSKPSVRLDGVAANPHDAREQLKQSNLRVLLVDDHPINRQVASLFLRPFNMRIVEAVNGAEALAALEHEQFDIVLLDMHMPVMDGPTTIARIRRSDKDWASVPVIALTADAMSGDKERYLAMGMDGYLSKPLAERDLLAEIARVRSGEAWVPAKKSLAG